MRQGEDQDHPEGYASQPHGQVGHLEAHRRDLLVTQAEDGMPLGGQEVDRPEERRFAGARPIRSKGIHHDQHPKEKEMRGPLGQVGPS